MKRKLALIPLALFTAFAGYAVFHPGLAYSEPRPLIVGEPVPVPDLGTYTVDPMHTNVYFEITHMGISQVHGRFNKYTGTIVENAKSPEKSTVEFSAEIGSIDTGVPPRDEHLRTAEYFDAAKYPALSFKSKKITKVKNGWVVVGDLTIKDKTKEISIPFRHAGPVLIQGMPDQPARVGIIADPITIKRSDFGIGSTDRMPDGTMPLSNDVIVRISLEGTLNK